MFSKLFLLCALAALVLADQDPQQQLDSEKVQTAQPIWQQYRPVIAFSRDAEGIQKTIRMGGNPFFEGIRVNVRPYPGGFVSIRTNGAEIIKPLRTTTESGETQDDIIIESQTDEQAQIPQQQQQLYQGYQQYKREVPYVYPQYNYLVRYPIWSRFLQPQQQQLYYKQQQDIPLYPYNYYRDEYYRPYGQYQDRDIYVQDQQQLPQQGEYDRVVRDTLSKKDRKSKGDKQEQLEKLEQQQEQQQLGLYPYRVPLYYQQYQRVPYQIYGKNIYDQQQQVPFQTYGKNIYDQQQQVPFQTYGKNIYEQQQQVPFQTYGKNIYDQQQQVPLQTYGRDIYEQQQRVPYSRTYGLEQQQQGPYTSQLLNRLMGYQQYYPQQYPLYYQQQQQQQYQPYNLPVYAF